MSPPIRLAALGYGFDVPLLDGDHVTDDTGTGFVHTAPGHGADDYQIWMANTAALKARGIDTTIPFTVDADGVMTKDAPGFDGKRVLTEKGDKGDANDAVIKALVEAGALIARGRLKHQYPHSWRSKKPVIFRNTPQWFIALDRPVKGIPKSDNQGLRQLALKAIGETEWVPASGENRIRGMIEGRPDWVISRQRAWGVPITVFVNKETGEVIPSAKFGKSKELIARIAKAFADEGADVWYAEGARERFLDGLVPDPSQWEQVRDILDVWFESGSTHAFVLDDPKHFPGLAGLKRVRDGGKDRVMYLEGSDQHRGWFQSSLLESCGSRGRAPFDVVLTHGFILDEKGEEKMSKSKGNTLSPQEVMKTSGADILRLWVASADFENDIRFGPAIVQASIEAYRKLRNTLRWMLGALGHLGPADRVKLKDMHDLELERLMLHRLAVLDGEVRAAYAAYDYRKIVALLSQFMNTELSAFYFDIRKDALYCEPYSSVKRRAALTVIDEIFNALVVWLAPILAFTAEEAWLARHDGGEGSSRARCTCRRSPRSRRPGATTSWRRSGSACATSAASSPARSSSSARPSASAPVSRPRLTSMSATAPSSARWRASTSPRWRSPAPRGSSPRCRRRTRSRCPTCPASASCRSSRRARSARAPGAYCAMSAPIRNFPICRRAMPPPCASSTPAPRAVRNERADRRAHVDLGPLLRAGPHRGARHAGARSGAQVVDAPRLGHRRPRPGRGDAVPRPRLREEHRHQLQPVRSGELPGPAHAGGFRGGCDICAMGVACPRGCQPALWPSAWG